MTISDADFRAWLDSETTTKTVLVEAEYMEVVPPGSEEPGVLAIEYLATRPFVAAPTDPMPNQSYRAWIKSIPQFAQSMSDLMIGRTTANIGEIVVSGGDAETDAWLFDRDWIGRGLAVAVGDESWPRSDFRSVWTGVIADLKMNGTNELVIVARDMQHLLNQPIQVPTFESGPSLGAPLPLVFGVAKSVLCLLVDATTHKYRVSDGPVASITNVRANGLSVGSQSLSVTTDLFDGSFTLNGTPYGTLTADVTGASYGSSAMDNAADLFVYFAVTRGYLSANDLDLDSIAQLRIDCPQKLSLATPAADTMVYEVLDQIVNTIGGFYAVDRDGKLYVRQFAMDGDPVLSITASDIVERGLTLQRIIQPVGEIRIGSAKNNASSAVRASSYTANGGFPNGPNETETALMLKSYQGVGSASNANGGQYAKMRVAVNPEPASNNGTEDPTLIPSLFVYAADAAAEATRRMTIWGSRRYVFRVSCFVAPLLLRLGDVVTLQHPRYGLHDGRNGVVVRIVERLSQKKVELDVLL